MKKFLPIALLFILIPFVSYAKIVGSGIALNTITKTNIANTYCSSVISVSFDPTNNTTGTTGEFVNLLDGTSGITETNEDVFIVPVDMYISQLYAKTATAPGSGKVPHVLTISDDAAETAVTCSITETNTTCSDTTNTALVAAGSKLTLHAEVTGSGSGHDASAEILASFCATQ